VIARDADTAETGRDDDPVGLAARLSSRIWRGEPLDLQTEIAPHPNETAVAYKAHFGKDIEVA